MWLLHLSILSVPDESIPETCSVGNHFVGERWFPTLNVPCALYNSDKSMHTHISDIFQYVEAVVFVMDLQLPIQSVPITIKVVSSNPAHGEVYSIQHYVIKFVGDCIGKYLCRHSLLCVCIDLSLLYRKVFI
jgi:hypothetical protein